MASHSDKAVYTALVANSLVTIAKFLAFAKTGSATMLSEAIHSAADVGNQSLLALGIKRSRAEATPEHPYGYSRERFIWALISAVGIFFLGCGFTLYHGVTELLAVHGGHAAHSEDLSPTILGAVLLFAFLIEGWALLVAVKAVNHARGDVPLLKHLKQSSDPMVAAVLLEDSVALLGVLVAAICIGLSIFIHPIFDPIGSIVIGTMLGVMAILLVNRNRELLLGEAPQPEVIDRIAEVLQQQPEVEAIHDVKAEVLGGGLIRFKAEIDFDAVAITERELTEVDLDALFATIHSAEDLRRALAEFGAHMVDAVGDAVDRIEGEAESAVPELAHVDLEAD
ncbi:MAG: cation diffusion facilitator family transporter [Myxococcota bacterium]|nr:cation diffusion facilitator family transporter [Myxococcota bacterium]